MTAENSTASEVRVANRRALYIVLSLLAICLAAALAVWLYLSWRNENAVVGKVQRYYDRSAGGTSATVGKCVSASDPERSILTLYACEVSSRDNDVFALAPAPAVRDHAGVLCFSVDGDDTRFFGVTQDNGRICLAAESNSSLYRH